jgi:hypothetical protein
MMSFHDEELFKYLAHFFFFSMTSRCPRSQRTETVLELLARVSTRSSGP